MKQGVLLQPMEDCLGVVIHLQRTEDPMLEHADMHGGGRNQWKARAGVGSCRSCGLHTGAHAGTGFLAETAAQGAPTLERPIPEGLYPLERTHAGEVLEGRDSKLKQGKSVRRKEWQRRSIMKRPIIPILHSPALLGGEESIEESGGKLSLGRRRGEGGEGGFTLVFYFSLPYSVINWQ